MFASVSSANTSAKDSPTISSSHVSETEVQPESSLLPMIACGTLHFLLLKVALDAFLLPLLKGAQHASHPFAAA